MLNVQDQQVSSMPNTAAATGHVDFILSPEEIASEIAKISLHPYISYPEPEETFEVLAQNQKPLKSIFIAFRVNKNYSISDMI